MMKKPLIAALLLTLAAPVVADATALQCDFGLLTDGAKRPYRLLIDIGPEVGGVAIATVVVDSGVGDELPASMGTLQVHVTSSTYAVVTNPGVAVVDIDRITGNAETRVLNGTGHRPGTCHAVTVAPKF